MLKMFITTVLALSLYIPAAAAQNLDGNPYDPARDPDIDLFMSNWKESMPAHTHGSLIERPIFTRGDNMHPPRKGAVLEYTNRFVHATLPARAITTPVTLDGEQEVLYILGGTGTITGAGKTYDLYKGIAVLVPAKLEFTMRNTSDAPLTMYLVSEPIPAGFRPNDALLVKDENTTPVVDSKAHWVGIVKGLFGTADGLGTMESILTCGFPAMSIFHPHSHVEGTEEIWTTIDQPLYVLLGKQLRYQPVGTAYMIPPDGNTPHANINTGDHTITMFYYARYADHAVRP